MFILSNFIIAVAKVTDIALTVYMWIIIFRALLSWVNPDPYNQIVIIMHRITEPVLAPIRRMIPMRNLGLDFSPIIVLLIIMFLKYFLVEVLIQAAQRL